MEYKLSELSDCVFGYLTTVSDIPQSLTMIWSHITGSTGHRCTSLDNNLAKHRRLFLETCDTLDNTYKNIHKFFKNGTFYIMYSDKTSEEVNAALGNYHNSVDDNLGDAFSTFGSDVIIDYFFNSKNNSANNKYTTYVKDYLSHCTVDDAKKIFGSYDFHPDKPLFGTSILDMAIQNNNTSLVAYLSKVKYESKITKLKADNLTFKKNNTILTLNNKTLEQENKKLKKELSRTHLLQYVPVTVLVSVIVALVGYNYF